MEQTKQILGHSLKVEIEKLDGGFVSNLSGKRRIYKDGHSIEDDINLGSVLNKSDDNEYILSIDLIPKDKYIDTPVSEPEPVAAVVLEEELISLDKAKELGIIQPVDKFDPEPKKPVSNVAEPIAVTVTNCYSIDQLSAIDWKKYDKDMPLTIGEKALISGIKDSTLYNLWIKVINGTFQWQSLNTRVGMTILAHYYEKRIENKKRKDEGLPPRNDKRLMEIVTEIELMCKSSMVKSNILLKKMDQFKKLLIQE